MPRKQDQTRDIESVLSAAGAGGLLSARLRATLWGGALAVLAALALWYWLGAGGDPATQYVTQPATRGDLTVTVTATGTVEPTNTVEISSELSGTVRTVLVDFNDRVRAGQHLAMLDTDKVEAQVLRSRATLAAARARVQVAEATVTESRRALDRQEKLAQREVASQDKLDAAKAAYDRAVASLASARADVAVAEANLKLEETNLAKSCICSPINGVVLRRNVEPGQTVASSLQAPVLFVVAEDLTKMELQVDVDEADVGGVKEGQEAVFTVDAYPGRKFPAKISLLRFASETVEGVVTYKAVLTVDNSDLLLRPGMTATAEITVKQIRDALLVPNAALRFSPPEEDDAERRKSLLERLLPGRPRFRTASKQETDTNRRVWVLRDGVPEAVSAVIGASDGTRTEILDGQLRPQDPVVLDVRTAKR